MKARRSNVNAAAISADSPPRHAGGSVARCAVAALAMATAAKAQPAQAPEIASLEPGQPVERVITAGEAHSIAAGSMKPAVSIFSISSFTSCRIAGPCR